jgi:hypothetical protein
MAERMRKALLLCGVISSVLYIGTDVLGALHWAGYSYPSQSISELMAIDSPSRPLVVPLFLAYGLLVIAFGFGIAQSAGRGRALRVVARLMLAYGLLDLVGPFVPVHQRGVQPTLSDGLHIVVTILLVLLILSMIAFGAAAFGRRFRAYSIATLILLIFFGTLTGMGGPRIVANLPTPWLGITERINIFGYMLWAAVLAIALLRPTAATGGDDITEGGGASISARSQPAHLTPPGRPAPRTPG